MEYDEDEGGQAQYLRLIGVPFLLVVAPLLGYFIGHWLDGFFHTSFLSFIFLSLGVVAAIREFYKLVKSLKTDDDDNDGQ